MDETMNYQQLKDKLNKLNNEQLNRPVMLIDTLSFGQSYSARDLKISEGDYLSKDDPFLTF
jgi:hypothetical protein